MQQAAAMMFVIAPLGAAILLGILITRIRQRKQASLAGSMLALGAFTAVANTAIGLTQVSFGHGEIFMLLWMPAWGFCLGSLVTLAAWLILRRVKLTRHGWTALGVLLVVAVGAAAVPFDTPVAPAVRLTLVDSSGAPVAAACARESWSYSLLNDHYEGDDHLSAADGRVNLPAHAMHASAMSRAADFWILGRVGGYGPTASVSAFATDGRYLRAYADSLRGGDLRLVMGSETGMAHFRILSDCEPARRFPPR